MTHERRASPLHVARASVASLYCLALAGAALAVEHPLVLGALGLAVLAAGASARVGRVLARRLVLALPFALLILGVNALVVRDGVTVLVRGWTLPVLGSLDVTLEAVAYGAILGLRALVLIGAFLLHGLAVDPDELLRAARRLGFRSALTVTLATRLTGVLARDAGRLRDAQRARGGPSAPRVAVLRAVTAGALERALDVAATLEVRGYGGARRAPGNVRPWSRHDLAFLAAAAAVAALSAAAVAGGWAPLEAYPRLTATVDARVAVVACALVACALLPFLDRRGVGG